MDTMKYADRALLALLVCGCWVGLIARGSDCEDCEVEVVEVEVEVEVDLAVEMEMEVEVEGMEGARTKVVSPAFTRFSGFPFWDCICTFLNSSGFGNPGGVIPFTTWRDCRTRGVGADSLSAPPEGKLDGDGMASSSKQKAGYLFDNMSPLGLATGDASCTRCCMIDSPSHFSSN